MGKKKPKKATSGPITEDMDLAEAIAISRTLPLETLLKNFQATAEGLVTLWRSAEEVLAECPDPQTMPRLLEMLDEDLKAHGNSTWFRPIELRLGNKAVPESDKKLAIAVLVPLVDRKADQDEREPVAANAMGALAAAQPLSPDVVKICARKLDHAHYHVASCALRVLVNLPPEDRSEWVPLLLKHLPGRFSENSEGTWIIECLPPHFQEHRDRIVPVLRAGLESDKSDNPFLSSSVLDVLHEVGSAATEMVPDVLAYISRQQAFTGEEPHLIHIDPEGAQAIPGLIGLLDSAKKTVRYQAVCELEAYGPRAQAAIPALTRLASTGKDKEFDVDAARRALAAIQQLPEAGEKKSGLERVLNLVERAVKEE
jgi:hypothetical protein